MSDPIELLTLGQTLQRIPVSRRTLFREIKAGRLRVVKIRGRTFVTSREIEAYLASRVRRVA